MRFLAIYKPEKIQAGPPNPEHMAEMGRYVEESMRNGTLLTTGSVRKAENGVRVRLSKGHVTVEDGSGPEGKAMTGFAILKADSKEELVDMITKFLRMAGDGVSEVHPLNEF